jgi:hypothetical protein
MKVSSLYSIYMNELIYYDEWGNGYVLDEEGNKRPPIQTGKTETHSGFTIYDSSDGHCSLCGRLTCNGSCFK